MPYPRLSEADSSHLDLDSYDYEADEVTKMLRDSCSSVALEPAAKKSPLYSFDMALRSTINGDVAGSSDYTVSRLLLQATCGAPY